jgi:hypothetical protein
VFQIEELKKTSKFEDEIRQEQEQRKREEEEKAQRRTAFKQKAALFQNDNLETNGSTWRPADIISLQNSDPETSLNA